MEAASSEESSLATNPTSLETLARLAVLAVVTEAAGLAAGGLGAAAGGARVVALLALIRCRARLS